MIQRPQSFLLLVVIIALMMITLVPIWTKYTIVYSVYAWCSQKVGPAEGRIGSTCFSYALIGLLAFAAIGIATYELFRYDNRVMQIKLGVVNTLVMIMLLGCILRFDIQEGTRVLLDVPGRHKLGCLLFAMALASNLLANYYIRQDEKLVKAAERMR